MPAAAPLPRGPSVPTLYDAADLLTGPGCPVCRYTTECADRYLTHFALEGHAQATTITRLCRSLGMCPRHTRTLTGQPGAAVRLTAVYRYVVEEARHRLAGQPAKVTRCPGCDQDEGAMSRALGTLLEGLDGNSVREHYRKLGGLCVPHVRLALDRAKPETAAWLAETLMAVLHAPSARLGWLTGTDYDAGVRAALRRALAAGAGTRAAACPACLASVQAEGRELAHLTRVSQPEGRLVLCIGHLNDLALLQGPAGLLPLLSWQADGLTSDALRSATTRRKRRNASLPILRRVVDRGPRDEGLCAVCRCGQDAASQVLRDASASLRPSGPGRDHQEQLCVRHLLVVRASGRRIQPPEPASATRQADLLAAQLSEAFRKASWGNRHEPRGEEMSAWRRAVVFLDGRVFMTCPAEDV